MLRALYDFELGEWVYRYFTYSDEQIKMVDDYCQLSNEKFVEIKINSQFDTGWKAYEDKYFLNE